MREPGRRAARADRARLVQGLPHQRRGGAGDRRRLAAGAPRRRGPAGPARRRRRGHARRDRGGRRLGVARGRGARSARPADPAGVAGPRGRRGGRSSRWRRRPASRWSPPAERDPVRATTHGTGDVLRAVLDAGIRDIALGIGGCATTDGGAGLLRALGADGRRRPRGGGPRRPGSAARARCGCGSPATSRTRCSGPDGAAAVYGPQKGATPELVAALDARLAGSPTRSRPRPGAASATPRAPARRAALGFGLLCLADSIRLAPRWSRASTSSWRRPASTRRSRRPTS